MTDKYPPTYQIMEQGIIEEAHQIGRADGLAASSWYDIDQTNYRPILTGLNDGDPEILDMLPYPDLSGQWADGRDLRDIIDTIYPDGDPNPDRLITLDDIAAEAYEEAYRSAVEQDIERRCVIEALYEEAGEYTSAIEQAERDLAGTYQDRLTHMLQLQADGWTTAQIASAYDITRQRVEQIITQ